MYVSSQKINLGHTHIYRIATEKRYRKLLENVKGGKVFKKEKSVKWKCRNCGYVHEGAAAPAECPACEHKQEYYEILAENY